MPLGCGPMLNCSCTPEGFYCWLTEVLPNGTLGAPGQARLVPKDLDPIANGPAIIRFLREMDATEVLHKSRREEPAP